jgi:cbb3-type cytochrome oxidase cytochrome c subunit
MNGAGGAMGPDLTHAARLNSDMDWQAGHLKDPAKYKPNSLMPPYGNLSDEQLKQLAAYLVSLK